VVVDGNLITGQNPASAQVSGRAVLQRLAADAAHEK
jgi:putative intracellular protease/amidase